MRNPLAPQRKSFREKTRHTGIRKTLVFCIDHGYGKNNWILNRILVIAKRNYRVYVELGLLPQFMVIYLTALETGAGPKFIVESALPPQLKRYRTSLARTTPLKDGRNDRHSLEAQKIRGQA